MPNMQLLVNLKCASLNWSLVDWEVARPAGPAEEADVGKVIEAGDWEKTAAGPAQDNPHNPSG